MSSIYVRTQIASFLAANAASEKVMDLTSLFGETNDNLAANTPAIAPTDTWVGVQYIGADEVPITLPATNVSGSYRETGAVFIHVVAPVGVASSGLLTRAEALRNTFRGQRIGQILILSVTPINTDNGATLQFEGGWMSASFLIEYQRDLKLP